MDEGNFLIRKEKVADSKVSGYSWTGSKKTGDGNFAQQKVYWAEQWPRNVRYNYWNISLQSSAKQHEMTNFCVFFYISIANFSLYSRFMIILTLINKLNDFRVSQDSWVKYKFNF